MHNRKKAIYEPIELGKVFTFLKTEKNILDITETGGISTIYTDSLVLLNGVNPILLAVGQIVTINFINYSVLSVNEKLKTFTITAVNLFHMSTDLIPVKVLDATKWNIAINYKFGSRTEINEILNNEVSNPDTKMQRFPLVWLFINDSRVHDRLDYDFKSSVKMAFINKSEVNYKSNDRLTNNIIPVIDPLKVLFLETIQSPYMSDLFNWEYEKLRYTDYIRYFYGSSYKNQMVLDAPTDAIEIILDLNFQNQY